MDKPRRRALPPINLIATSLFFTGVTFASTLNYAAIVGIDTLGIPNALYSLLLMGSSLVGAAASVIMGYISDRVPDRRVLVIGCALMGALGFGLIFAFRTPLAFVLAIGLIMPFGGALFSQSFSFARAYNDRTAPTRAEFRTSVLRTIFAVAWAVVPPAVGVLAATTGVFSVYGVGAAAYLVCAGIFALLLLDPGAQIGVDKQGQSGHSAGPPRSQVDRVVVVGTLGVSLISIATYVNNVAVPLLITSTLRGSFGDLGLFAGLAAAMELPFMILWGYALRRIGKHTIIVLAALLYCLYLVLVSRATQVSDLYWLQIINGPATAALMSIPISYMQDAIRGRVGLSTSLLDVVGVASSMAAAALFGLVTASAPNYPLLFVIGAGFAAAGAAIVFAAHRLVPAGAASR